MFDADLRRAIKVPEISFPLHQNVLRLLEERAKLLEALQAVSRLDYLQEHNALAEKARAAIAFAESE